MSYKFIKNCFSVKFRESDTFNVDENVHSVKWNRCNYRCSFCSQAAHNFKKQDGFKDLTENEFIATVLDLMNTGKNFKFTGGEPSLNPNIIKDISIVKGLGGKIFLDTNGSNPNIVRELLEKNLIDVLAVSIKGLSKEECLKTAEIKNSKLCWENVFETINMGAKYESVKVIVTHVCFDDFCYEELVKFTSLLPVGDNVYCKLNNLHIGRAIQTKHKRIDTNAIIKAINRLILENPKWKDHVVFNDTHESTLDRSNLKFY